MAATLIRCAALALMLAVAPIGRAREAAAPGALGNDPTRPPDRVLKQQQQQQATPGAPGAAPASLADPGKLVLQAIIQSEGRPARIMIDGWLYRTGDIVHGCKLISISSDSAEFDAEGQKLRISLTPQASIAIARTAESASPLPAQPSRPPARPMPKERQ